VFTFISIPPIGQIGLGCKDHKSSWVSTEKCIKNLKCEKMADHSKCGKKILSSMDSS
jgi:hypothetical protein